MSILVGKLLTQLIYPTVFFAVLVALALFQFLAGRTRVAFGIMLLGSSILLFAATPKVAQTLAGSLERQYPALSIDSLPHADVAVVLGGMLDTPLEPRLEIELTETADRLHHAFRVWKAGKVRKIFVTGGNVYQGFRAKTESEYAQQLLIEWGVDPAAIAIDTEAKTTEQNAIQAAAFLQQEGIKSQKVFLVTSALHMPRSVEHFKAVGLTTDGGDGIELIPVSADILVTSATRPAIFNWIPSAAALSLTTWAWHEKVGLWVFKMRSSVGD